MKSELVEELNREARQETQVEMAQKGLIRHANRKFGASPRNTKEILTITDLDRLERLADAIFDVNSLDELLSVM